MALKGFVRMRLFPESFFKDIARQLGVSEDTLRFWEVNRNSHKLTYLPKIMEFLSYSPEMVNQTPGAKLKTYRTTKGLTQKAFARILGLDPGTLAKWEVGKGKLPEWIWDLVKFSPS